MNKYDYNNLTPFKWFVLENFPFIEADFDALTNWQLFCKLGKEMNKIINTMNNLGQGMEDFSQELINSFNEFTTSINTTVEDYIEQFNTLKDYVENYFDNLDVQEEINNKLDDMVEQGTLQEIITSYLNSKALFCYDTVALMKQATNLIDGSFTKTLGFYAKNDGGSSIYKIRTKTNEDIIDEMKILSLYDNTLVAEFIKDTEFVNVMQFGLNVNDTATNITSKINNIVNFGYNLIFNNLTFNVNDKMDLKSNTKIKFQNCSITNESETNQKYILNIANINNVEVKALNTLLQFTKPSTDQQACIRITNSKNIYIEGFTIEKAGGDGIILSGTSDGDTENIIIKNCIINNNRRNGIAVIGGVYNIEIDNCKITNTSGANPQYGIDLEPWQTSLNNNMITIRNCYFSGNNGGIDIFSNNQNLQIINNNFDGNGISSVLRVELGENAYPKNCLITDNNFKNSGIYLRGTQFGEYNILNNKFDNAGITTDAESDFTAISGIPSNGFLNIKNNILKNKSSGHAISIGASCNVIVANNYITNCNNRAFSISATNTIKIIDNIVRNYQMSESATSSSVAVLITTTRQLELINNVFYKDESTELVLTNLIDIKSNAHDVKLINNKAPIGNYTNFINNESNTVLMINNESKTLYNDTTKYRLSASEKRLGTIMNRWDTTNNYYVPTICVNDAGVYKWQDL